MKRDRGGRKSLAIGCDATRVCGGRDRQCAGLGGRLGKSARLGVRGVGRVTREERTSRRARGWAGEMVSVKRESRGTLHEHRATRSKCERRDTSEEW